MPLHSAKVFFYDLRFFCTGTVLVGFDRCRLDAQVFKIGFDVKGLEDGDKESGASPSRAS